MYMYGVYAKWTGLGKNLESAGERGRQRRLWDHNYMCGIRASRKYMYMGVRKNLIRGEKLL